MCPSVLIKGDLDMTYSLINWDDMHYDGTLIDGHNKPFNFIISERELGKTTWFWVKKSYREFCKTNRPTLVIRRLIADITDVYIADIEKTINAFQSEKIQFVFKKGSIKEGVVDIYLDEQLFLRILALSNPMSRIKSLRLDRIKYLVFDEFICNTRLGEKYVDDEAFKFREVYNTFQRFCYDEDPSLKETLKCYFLGNPYSLYNPYFVWIGVDTKKIHKGCLEAGINWVVHCGELSQKLREFIRSKNPLYQFDDSYTKYAFGGEAINDSNINIVDKQPEYFKLRHIFKIDTKYLYVYVDTNPYKKWELTMWAEVRSDYEGKNRAIFCFDFRDLVNNTVLMSAQDKAYFDYFKQCVRFRRIGFKSIEASYLAEEIYKNT